VPSDAASKFIVLTANTLLNPPINTRDKIPAKRYSLLLIFNNFQSFNRIKALCNGFYRLDNLDDTLGLFMNIHGPCLTIV
jgi:hypothetical protein